MNARHQLSKIKSARWPQPSIPCTAPNRLRHHRLNYRNAVAKCETIGQSSNQL